MDATRASLPQPLTAALDDFGIQEAGDGLGQGIGMTDADVADRGFDACLHRVFGVFYRQTLRSPVRMMDQSGILGRPTIKDGLS